MAKCRRGRLRLKEPGPSVVDWKTELKIIDGRVYVDLRGLISNLIITCEVVEKSRSEPKP